MFIVHVLDPDIRIWIRIKMNWILNTEEWYLLNKYTNPVYIPSRSILSTVNGRTNKQSKLGTMYDMYISSWLFRVIVALACRSKKENKLPIFLVFDQVYTRQ